MVTPSSTPGRELDGDPPAGGARLPDDDILLPPRRRASPLKVVAVAVVSIIVTGLAFRVAVEVLRRFVAP